MRFEVGSVLRMRRLVTVWVLLCCAVASAVVPGAGIRPMGSAVATAASDNFEVSEETLQALADVRPGDRVKVVIQNKIQLDPTVLSIFMSTISICPAPYPGTPNGDFFRKVCFGPSSVPQGAVSPDANGRFEFWFTIPPEGENSWPKDQARDYDLSCAPRDKCGIGFTYTYVKRIAGRPRFFPSYEVTSMPFTVKPPVSVEGCQAPRESISALGPYRLFRSDIAWAQDRCAGGKPQDLDYTSLDEVSGREAFRQGDGDMFFGSGGVTANESAADAAKRKAVPVPVALNAMVLAIYGYYPEPGKFPSTQIRRDFSDVKLTASQLAEVLRDADRALTSGALATEVTAANPQLAAVNQARRGALSVGAYATSEPGHWLTSRYLVSRAGDAWRYEDNRQPIGELWDLSPLNPGGGSKMVLVGDRPSMGKMLTSDAFASNCADGSVFGCVEFVLTDAATAAELKLPVVKLQNAAGKFVEPTAQSTAAAVKDMKELPDGSLVADPESQSRQAYPLTFVDYAYAPEKALLNVNCQPTGKQTLIKDVLGYLIGNGQDKLAEGVQPLPPSLWRKAGVAVERVGADTAGCTPASSDDPSGDAPASDSPPVTDPGTPTSDPTTAPTTSSGAAGNHPTQPVTAAGQQEALNVAQQTRIPLFAGLAATLLVIPLAALAMTNGLTSGAAFGSAGRRPSPRVTAAAMAVAGWLRRLRGTALRLVRIRRGAA